MTPIGVGATVLSCVFGGALLGMSLRNILPEHHLSTESRDVIKLGMGLTATMSALVLALLTASAKSSFDTQRTELTQMSANVVLLDRLLAHYGPETGAARTLLRSLVGGMIQQLWPEDNAQGGALEPLGNRADVFYDAVEALSPHDDAQRSLKVQALKMSVDLGQTRWLLYEQKAGSIPMPFLILLIFWVTTIFISFGLFAPPNMTVIVSLFFCALSIAGAIFLILEMDLPFGGIIHISDAPLRNAFAHLGH